MILSEGISLHFISSFLAGFVAVCIGSPFDVLKSRIMDGKISKEGHKIPYKSVLEAFGSLSSE